ncbi:MAG: T9SS type A sorting domain-containing protein [Vicingaceae bacterium]
MKTLFTMIVISCLIASNSLTVHAQDYTFYTDTIEYTELTNSSIVTADFNQIVTAIPFGSLFGSTFNLKVNNMNIYQDTIYIGTEGYIFLQTLNRDTNIFIDPFFSFDIKKYNATSSISHKIEKINGVNHYVIQWKNVETDDFPGDFINFQLKINENNQDITFHYGSSNVSTSALSSKGFQIGMFLVDGLTNNLYSSLTLEGSENNPSVSSQNVYMFSNPKESRRYIFRNNLFLSFESHQPQGNKHLIYPNPCINELHLEGFNNVKRIEIIDVFGRIVKSISSGNLSVIELSNLKTGVYFVKPIADKYNFNSIKFFKK